MLADVRNWKVIGPPAPQTDQLIVDVWQSVESSSWHDETVCLEQEGPLDLAPPHQPWTVSFGTVGLGEGHGAKSC